MFEPSAITAEEEVTKLESADCFRHMFTEVLETSTGMGGRSLVIVTSTARTF